MASRIEITDVTIPAGTAIATPLRVFPNFNDGIVERIEMRWPPGPSGLVGLRIGHSGQVTIPFRNNTFLITDNELVSWPVEAMPTANKWFVDGYNVDVFDHTVQFRWLISEMAVIQATRPPLVPIV